MFKSIVPMLAVFALSIAGCDQPLDAESGEFGGSSRALPDVDQEVDLGGATHCRPNPCGKDQVQDPKSGCCIDEPAGETCGEVTCASYEECCNASCGICVMPDESCTQQVCDPGT